MPFTLVLLLKAADLQRLLVAVRLLLVIGLDPLERRRLSHSNLKQGEFRANLTFVPSSAATSTSFRLREASGLVPAAGCAVCSSTSIARNF